MVSVFVDASSGSSCYVGWCDTTHFITIVIIFITVTREEKKVQIVTFKKQLDFFGNKVVCSVNDDTYYMIMYEMKKRKKQVV